MGNTGGRGWDRRLLEWLAPRDAEAALADLQDERDRSVDAGRHPLLATAAYGVQILGVCAWAVLDRLRPAEGFRGTQMSDGSAGPGALRPLQAGRMAIRGLFRAGGTASLAIVILGVGLTATVAVLGLVAGLSRTLPVPAGHEVVQVEVLDARSRPVPPPTGVLAQWSGIPGLQAVAAVQSRPAVFIGPDGTALRLPAAEVSPGLLELLRVPPARGRVPTGIEDRDGVLLAWDVWKGALGGDPDIIGATVRMDDRPRTVLGIMPEGFGFPERQSLWTVMEVGGGFPPDAEIVARIGDGATEQSVIRRLEDRMAVLRLPPEAAGPYRVRIRPWASGRGEGGELVALGALGTLAGLLLLVCAANVSALLLVRATERARALAVHAALGASRAQIVLQLLLESFMVAVAGGLVGLVGGGVVLAWMEANLAQHWGYYWMRMGLTPRVALEATAAVFAAALVAGTAPALLALRADLRGIMASGGSSSRAAGKGFARWFVGVQVALSTAGLVAALVLARGFVRSGELMETLPLDEVAVASVSVDSSRYADPGARRDLAADMRAALAALPGVQSASVSGAIPILGGGVAALTRPDDPEGEDVRAPWFAHGPGLFETYGMQLLAGRSFTDRDRDGGPVVVVSERFASRHLSGGPAVGARLRLGGVHSADEWATVVGVVADATGGRGSGSGDRGAVYVPFLDGGGGPLWLSARVKGDLGTVVAALRPTVKEVAPELPVEGVRSLRSLAEYLLRIPRSFALFGALGGLAGVVVAAIGLYGVVSFQTRTRWPELGVRMAMGASATRVARLVVRGTLARMAPGVAVGLLLGFLMSPVLHAFAFGSGFAGVPLLGTVAAIMVVVGGLAALQPALGAARLQPGRILSAE